MTPILPKRSISISFESGQRLREYCQSVSMAESAFVDQIVRKNLLLSQDTLEKVPEPAPETPAVTPEIKGPTEITDLGRSMNKMAGDLPDSRKRVEESKRKVEGVKEHLKDLVEERTRDLKTANAEISERLDNLDAGEPVADPLPPMSLPEKVGTFTRPASRRRFGHLKEAQHEGKPLLPIEPPPESPPAIDDSASLPEQIQSSPEVQVAAAEKKPKTGQPKSPKSKIEESEIPTGVHMW